MTVRLPRVLLVPLCLLTLATSAHAECAWVLWVGVDKPDRSWGILTSFPRMQTEGGLDMGWAACEKRIKDTAPKLYTDAVKGGATGFHAICLPDTVDPRGPRGK